MTRLASFGSKLFGAMFAASALAKVATFSKQRAMMEAAGIPLARPGLVLATLVEGGSAGAALAGIRPRLTATVMIGYIAVVTAALPARKLDDDALGIGNRILLAANLTLIGTLVWIARSAAQPRG